MSRQRSTSSSKTSGYPSYLTVPPRFGTFRNFERPTYGTRQGKVARLLGKPFMPHQQYMADVLGEVDPRTGLRVYREAVVTMMRQCGKTTYVVTAKVHRALDTVTPQRILFAAQTGDEAKMKWLEHIELVKRTPLGVKIPAGQPTVKNGRELLTWVNGSTERPISSKPGSGHGVDLDMGVITEAFALPDDRYEQTMLPAMRTRPDAQFIVESTAGDATSIYWNERVEAERLRMLEEPDRPSRTAFFDWSFDPDEDDIGAEETWLRRIPAIGYTIRLDEIRHEWESANTPKKLRAFKRGTGNITDLGAEAASAFPEGDWEDTASDEWNIAGPRAFALDVTNDRSWASIGQAGPNEIGEMQLELVAHERSTHWVVPALVDLFARNPRAPRRVYVVAGGQAALMAKAIEKKDIEVVVLSRADYAAGCAKVFDEVDEQLIAHRATGQVPLDEAVGGAAWSGGDARVWDRLKSTSIIAPLVAVTAARWGFELEQSRAVDLLDTIA